MGCLLAVFLISLMAAIGGIAGFQWFGQLAWSGHYPQGLEPVVTLFFFLSVLSAIFGSLGSICSFVVIIFHGFVLLPNDRNEVRYRSPERQKALEPSIAVTADSLLTTSRQTMHALQFAGNAFQIIVVSVCCIITLGFASVVVLLWVQR